MNKQQFLAGIREKLTGLPQNDIDKSLDYYDEMIQDRVEEGLSEDEAVEALGSMEDIAAQILSDTPLPKTMKVNERVTPKFRAWEIILLILGFPVWMPLLMAAFVLVLAFYIIIWSVIFSLYATNLALAISAIGGFAGSVMHLFYGNGYQSVLFFGACLICAGLSVLMFLGLLEVAKGTVFISKKVIQLIIKLCSSRKEKSK